MNNSTSPLWEITGMYASFEFTKASIGHCTLTNCHIPQLRIQNECVMELYVSGGAINHLNFSTLTLGKNSVVSIANAVVYACDMNQFAVLGNLYLRSIQKAKDVFEWLDIDAKLNELFKDDESKKGVRYERAKSWMEKQKEDYGKHCKGLKEEFKTSTFRLAQSSLGKTEFTECDLAGFRFEYNNAKLTEVFISGGSLPEKGIVILGEKEGTKVWFQQKVSVYNQLKKVFAAQGDVYYESVFHAQTSHHQLFLLKHLRKEKNYRWFRWLFSEQTFDIITFRLNQYSNKHGASWGRALVFVLLFPLIIFIFFLGAAGLLHCDTNAGIDWDLLGNYFTVLNPTHKTDFIPLPYKPNNTFWTNFWDFINRIVVGYGIYQLISAFRKHGKKV